VEPDRLAPLLTLATIDPAATGGGLDPLERSEAEDALTAWLEHRSVHDAWLAAETLVSAGVTEPNLDEAIRALPEAMVPPALRWLEADLAARRLLDEVAEATRRITELIGSVKAYSNMDRAPTKSAIDVHEGIRSTLAMLAHELRSKEIGVKTDLDPLLPRVRGNPGDLNQVWMNLIDNAVDVLPPGGVILVATSHSDGEAIVQVVDNGPGMPPEVQRRAFEPFFTTKEVGEGTGLGLDIVQRIVRDHEGSVHVESAPGRTCFEIRLPASPSEPVSKPA
jgi:signal transduction histidine kinase